MAGKAPVGRAWGKSQQRVEPDGRIRPSQLITTFGPGAMLDLVDDAVLVGGLDFWRFAPRAEGVRVLTDRRLRDDLADRLRASDRLLRVDGAFREPPAGKDAEPGRDHGIAVVEFPRWFVCASTTCRALVRSDSLERINNRYVHRCDGREQRSPSVPVRFVLACPRGHLDDFPWIDFAHGPDQQRCEAPELRLEDGASGDFEEVAVRCRCKARRRMMEAYNPDMPLHCRGWRPWLGPEGKEACTEKGRLLVRTASNSYFAQVESALSLPESDNDLRAAVERCWETLQVATADTLKVFRQIPKVAEALKDASDADVLRIIDEVRAGVAPAREPLRTAEFRTFLAQPRERPGELPQPEDLFFARAITPRDGLPRGVSRVVLASKLRELRVLVGFTRFEPAAPNLQGEHDLAVKTSPLGLQTDWLPANEVLGEGVFLQLDEGAVREWERREAVKAREERLRQGYQAWASQGQGKGKAPPFPGARFYLLHSLSHLLLSAVSLECGYPASAIRERIYCAPADAPVPMAAILLSTGTSGAEGTLGGLVEQGRELRYHLSRALTMGRLCSNDPVCAAHTPTDLTERPLEGAACHGCLFVAECSCERFNRYLDRSLVVPTLDVEDAAFFSDVKDLL